MRDAQPAAARRDPDRRFFGQSSGNPAFAGIYAQDMFQIIIGKGEHIFFGINRICTRGPDAACYHVAHGGETPVSAHVRIKISTRSALSAGPGDLQKGWIYLCQTENMNMT